MGLVDKGGTGEMTERRDNCVAELKEVASGMETERGNRVGEEERRNRIDSFSCRFDQEQP